MASSSAREGRRKQGTRYRGYRIRVYPGQGKPSFDLPIIFAGSVPAAWEEVKQNTTIQAATLYRSGRKFREHKGGQA